MKLKGYQDEYHNWYNSQKAAELFEQEAMRLNELGKHPQIPELLAHFGQDNHQYLILEFIDGQNLAQALAAEGAFNQAQIRNLLSNVLPVLQFIASGSADKTIKIWQLGIGEELSTLTGHSSWVNSVAFSLDGETLASGSGDGTIKIWQCD